MSYTRATAAQQSLVVIEVSDTTEWARLEVPWDQLAVQARCRAFLTFGWFAAAWEWRRAENNLLILAVCCGPKLVGALPLMRPRVATSSVRQLSALTVPDTQYFDIVAAPDDSDLVADAIAAALMGRRDWDELQLSHLSDDCIITRALLPKLRGYGARSFAGLHSANAYIPLTGTWSEFYATRSRSLKKANNLAANRLAKAGAIRIEHYAPGNDDSTWRERVLAAAIGISARSWKRTTGNSLDQSGPQGFITALTMAAGRRDELSVWLAYLDDKPVAMEYQLVAAGNVYALRADFDAACVDISPGSHLFRHLLEAQFGLGWTRYYMGPGDNPYKARWTELAEPLAQANVLNRTLRGCLRWQWLQRLRPRLRVLRDRFRQFSRAQRAGPRDAGSDN